MASRPKRNRVQPTGEILALPTRGCFMGNRGSLPDDHARLDRHPWTSRAWLVCDLAFRGQSRANTGRAKYTKLFFLDEAVALAAGHRPCAFCRGDAYRSFRGAWQEGLGTLPSATALDAQLHSERVERSGSQRRHEALLEDLPDGAFILHPDGSGPALVQGDALLPYTRRGYDLPAPRPRQAAVTVLTPPSTLAVLRAGYRPAPHPDADALLRA